MRVVGLTGNIASGKSEVARLWAAAGVPVLDSDALAREAVRPGSDGLAAVVEAFGPEVLAPDGSLDRARMRQRVFRDPRARARLEGILHPRIAALRDRWLAERRAAGDPLVVVEIPLLFEVGLEDTVDLVVLVDAPPEIRLERLVRARGLEPEEARRLMASQLDPAAKRARAHHVLDNSGTLAELHRAAEELLARLDLPSGGA